ncbi:MAG TPA: CHAD domain-containing protein [Caldilineaceae bacterium]|nr:CHAD domain-containing protein [Caldilineaceae bacterium]
MSETPLFQSQRHELAAEGVAPPLPVGLGSTPLTETARRSLQRFFDKLLACEETVLAGEDATGVHQMRVATRRLRASLQVLEGVYDHKLIRRHRRGLRQIAQSLGAVRDGDVFLAHIALYRHSLPRRARNALKPLVGAVAAERSQARQLLLKELTGKEYPKFKQRFSAFLTTPGKGELPSPEAGVTQRVRDFAGSAIWRRYELWRAYETVLPGGSDQSLHQARIAGKQMRYTIEFFADTLGPQVQQVLAPLIALQDGLGVLQDGVTARSHIAALGYGSAP